MRHRTGQKTAAAALVVAPESGYLKEKMRGTAISCAQGSMSPRIYLVGEAQSQTGRRRPRDRPPRSGDIGAQLEYCRAERDLWAASHSGREPLGGNRRGPATRTLFHARGDLKTGLVRCWRSTRPRSTPVDTVSSSGWRVTAHRTRLEGAFEAQCEDHRSGDRYSRYGERHARDNK
jgi:hypothetical protein